MTGVCLERLAICVESDVCADVAERLAKADAMQCAMRMRGCVCGMSIARPQDDGSRDDGQLDLVSMMRGR